MQQNKTGKIREALSQATNLLYKLRPRKPNKREATILGTILVLLGILSYIVIVYVPASNAFCATCHNMVPFMEGIEPTGHGALNCHACHSLGPEVVKELFVQITENPSATEILEEAGPRVNLLEPCLKCHTEEALLEKEIHRSHWSLVTEVTGACDVCHHPHFPDELAYSCNNCHQLTDVVESHSEFHEWALLAGERTGELTCAQCHSTDATWYVELSSDCVTGQVLGMSCFDCHPAPLDPPRVQGGTCLDCHSG